MIHLHLATILADIPNPFWDKWFMELIKGMSIKLGNGDFVRIAKEIAAVLSLLYFSVKAYAMIVGEGRLEIMPLMRPFVITLVIVNFNLYASIVGGVGKAATEVEQGAFEANAKGMDALQFTKDSAYDELWRRVLDSTAAIRGQMTQELNSVSDASVDAMTSVGMPAGAGWFTSIISKPIFHAANAVNSFVTIYEQLLWAKISMWLQHFIEAMVMAIFKGVAYCMFFIQMLVLHVLVIVGPISFAMSIIKPFKDSWVLWTQKYFAASFYVAVALIALNMGLAIISYGLNQEISRITQMLNEGVQQAGFLKQILHFDNFIGYLMVALLVVIGGIIIVPSVCGWILGFGGEAIGGYHRFAGQTRQAITGAAKKGVAAAAGGGGK